MADQALEAMRDEYPELDADAVSARIDGQTAVGYDANFFSLDLTNSCWIRAFSARGRTVLLFAQANDLDLADGERSLRAIFASIKIATGGPFAE